MTLLKTLTPHPTLASWTEQFSFPHTMPEIRGSFTPWYAASCHPNLGTVKVISSLRHYPTIIYEIICIKYSNFILWLRLKEGGKKNKRKGNMKWDGQMGQRGPHTDERKQDRNSNLKDQQPDHRFPPVQRHLLKWQVWSNPPKKLLWTEAPHREEWIVHLIEKLWGYFHPGAVCLSSFHPGEKTIRKKMLFLIPL